MLFKYIFAIFIIVFCGCNYQYKIRTGDQAFEVKQYAKAASMFKLEFTETSTESVRAEKAYKLGLCSKFTGDYQQSLHWFRTAYDLNFGPDALREYAIALKNNGEYEAAANAFQLYGDEIKSPLEVRKEISICKLMQQWEQSPSNYLYSIVELPEVNGEGSSYGYQRFLPDEWMYVSEKWNTQNKSQNKFEWTGRPFSDLMVKSQNSNVVGSIFNSAFNEGAFSYSPVSDKLYFTRCDKIIQGKQFCKIYESIRTKDTWSTPEELIMFEEASNQMHPAMHASDSIFVFSSDHQDGLGKFDLYYVLKNGDEWSDPINFGESINTEFDEVFPVWNGDTLYFSSSGLVGMGGLDLYKTHFSSQNTWSPPINLKNPINSESDDFHYYIDQNANLEENELQKAYFSSNRTGSGLDKIYQVITKEKILNQELPKKEPYKFDIIAKIRFLEPGSYTGSVEKILDSINLVDKKSKSSFSTTSNKVLTLKLLAEQTYEFVVGKPGYLNRDISFSSPAKPDLDRDSILILNMDYELIPVVYNREFLLKELYYDFDKWEIREDAIPALQNLMDIMQKNPKIVVLIGSHTDCIGMNDYNLNLSEKRAKSAADWLIMKGIQKERIAGKGFGATNQAINCKCTDCTEEQHQANRRSTFQLIPPKN
ncbi:MAG: OmpA family protein [Saprospiraceae bacterium]|nr:OmpA family protein [Saprospiraceae bacterium]